MRLRTLLGVLLGALVWLWVHSLRVRVTWECPTEGRSRRRVFAFLHGNQVLLAGLARRENLTVMVSRSTDGDLQTGVMSVLGVSVVRGSSSRGAARGLRAIVSALEVPTVSAGFAVDGPRGPRGRSKRGAAAAARLSGATLLPVAAVARRSVVLHRTWDRFELPLPFSRVVVIVGAPVDAVHAERDGALLDTAVERCRERAASLLSSSGPMPVDGLESA